MKKLICVLVLVSSAVGCATIKHTATVQQPVGKQLIAGVGDVVARFNKRRNLENAFGKSDIFGRKTNEGFTELRFAGVETSGEVVLYRKEISIITNETTMSRTPVSLTTGSSNTSVAGRFRDENNSTTLNANARTTYTGTTISPASDFHVAIPSDTLAIRIAPGDSKVPIEGYVVEIIKATPYSLEYEISRR